MRQFAGELPEPEIIPETQDPGPKRRRRRWPWVMLVVLVLGAVWLNGPGFRLIAPHVTIYYLERLGIRGDFKVKGNVSGGLSVSELVIEGDDALAKLTIDNVTPEYRLGGLLGGELDGLTFEGVHAELRLGDGKKDEEKKPLDLRALVARLQTVRGRAIPLNLDVKDFTLSATEDGTSVFQLGSSSISHKKGSEDFVLRVGSVTDAVGREWTGQEAKLKWEPERITMDRLDLVPGLSILDFVLEIPKGGEPSLGARVTVDDAVLSVASRPGLSSAEINLLEGEIRVGELLAGFGIPKPLDATITSLAVDLENLLPSPMAATGSVRILLEDVAWQDWTSPEVSFDATINKDQASVVARGLVLGSETTLEAAMPITRSETGVTLGDAQGKFGIADVPRVLRALAERTDAIDPKVPIPPSALNGNFQVNFLPDYRVEAAATEITLSPKDVRQASPITLRGRWAPSAPITAEVVMDGLTAGVTYQLSDRTYQGTLEAAEFTNRRIDPWLAIFKVHPGGTGNITGSWSGNGDLTAGTHSGNLALTQGNWARSEMPLIVASGGIRYNWPGSFETSDLKLGLNDQSVVLDAALADGIFTLENLLWKRGDQELVEGKASLPVPQDFSKWRQTLANDARPVEVSIISRELSLGLLKDWVPALAQLDARSTGKLDVSVSGTYAEPVIVAKLEAKELRSPARPNLPPADLRLDLNGRDGRLALEGTVIAPDFPAATITASMPFRPSVWARNPEELKLEPIEGRVGLPRLDLSRFTTLVPIAKQLSGEISGSLTLGGKVGEPDLRGTLALTGGGLVPNKSNMPTLEGLAATADFTRDQITLANLKTTVAGGSLQGEGNIAILNGGLGNIDFRLRADHLPIVRNELLLIRANADLRVQGPWQQAAISGTLSTVDSIFFRDVELLPIGKPFTTPSAAAVPKLDARKSAGASIPEPFRSWTLNATASTSEPLLIRGNLANGDVQGTIKLGGTLGDPKPNGTLNVRNFTASLPFTNLDVRSGTATFTPDNGFDPLLEIRGTAEPRPYLVNVYVYGRASDPQLVLTSTPPLPDNEIMTLLATGTTTAGLEDPQAASALALQLLVEELRRGRFRFGQKLRPVLALLDRVDFTLAEADPYTSETYSTATLSITDRWFLSAGVGESGDNRLMAIWRMTFR